MGMKTLNNLDNASELIICSYFCQPSFKWKYYILESSWLYVYKRSLSTIHGYDYKSIPVYYIDNK